jgi:hypothetical protein
MHVHDVRTPIAITIFITILFSCAHATLCGANDEYNEYINYCATMTPDHFGKLTWCVDQFSIPPIFPPVQNNSLSVQCVVCATDSGASRCYLAFTSLPNQSSRACNITQNNGDMYQINTNSCPTIYTTSRSHASSASTIASIVIICVPVMTIFAFGNTPISFVIAVLGLLSAISL